MNAEQVELQTQKENGGELTFHHITRIERYQMGKQLRKKCPRSSHEKWEPARNRLEPVELVTESDKGRVEKLIPFRHGRMARSPFTFYRGAALNMAADLSGTPVTGVRLQACGDAHLSNFGGFATPERNVIFSINDLDETLPAPWEWDVKRLGTSFVVACRNNNLSESIADKVVLRCICSYRENMAAFSRMKTMDLSHFSLRAEMMISKLKDTELRRRAEKRLAKERGRSVAEEIFPKLEKGEGNLKFIKDQPPFIFHWEGYSPGEIAQPISDAFALYRESLPAPNRLLLDRYRIKDAAIKVVGVGSVGTTCWILLLMTADGEPFFLQAKEARSSVLEPYAGKSIFPNHGERV